MRLHLLCIGRVECVVSSALFTSTSLRAAGWSETNSHLKDNSSSSRPSDLSVELSMAVAIASRVTAAPVIDSADLQTSSSDGAPSLSPRQDTTAEFWAASRSPESVTLLTRVRVAPK
jgi:hypothetical protein